MGVNRLKEIIKKIDFKAITWNKKSLGIVFSLILIFIFAVFVWREIYVPKDVFDKEIKIFSIKKGDSAKTIAENLKSQGIIKNESFFKVYIIFRGISKKIQAGSYEISPSMSVSKIAGIFSRGEAIDRKIKIIEGWDLDDILSEVSREGTYTESQILESIYSIDVSKFILDLGYLGEKEKKNNYEGYFFPDTYSFNLETSPKDFLKSIFSNFDKKLTPDLKKEIERQKKTIPEIIIMASIIEKEVKSSSDKKVVSGILWKRIKIGMPLQVDASLLYKNDIIDGNRVLISDTKVDSPYNTYKNKGLTPGPISNPGIESIKAAIYPTSSNYLYYLSAPGGQTIFSETFSQHVANKAKYLR